MKIRIESESAKKLSLTNGLQQIGCEDDVILDFLLEKQVLSCWCWAAIGASIGKFYKTCFLTQQQIADKLLNISPGKSSKVDDIHNNNKQLTLDKSLKIAKSYSHWSLGRPSFERILLELTMGHPVCVRIEWFTGGAHYLVIKGANPKEKSLYLDDSLNGQSIMSYSHFPKRYNDIGGVWTETFWTAPNIDNQNSETLFDKQDFGNRTKKVTRK
ncbi:MAG: papain-like cysteine protease family protein [Calothrix sp. MO_167.B42]|nr:papain-like cysteine protease family protein [Calothrix sp. MO_167.B42]